MSHLCNYFYVQMVCQLFFCVMEQSVCTCGVNIHLLCAAFFRLIIIIIILKLIKFMLV